jgi:pimeloyl-ACP methyl ester carboxylesterase
VTDPEVVRLPDGRRAHLWQGGTTTGPAVLFFHGCPDTRLAARPGHDAAVRLGVRLVAVSRPGYGLSDAAASGHLSVADDTVAVADLLGIDRFAVLGMSVGGPYALACAAVHPERVTAAGVVAAPALVPALDPPWPRDNLASDGQEFFTRLARTPVDECDELMRPDYEQFVARVAPHDPDDEALARRWAGGLPPQDATLIAALPDADVAEQARESVGRTEGYLRDAAVSFRDWEFDPGQVRCPTFLWYGDLDQQVSLRNAHWLTEHLPDATLVVREGSGHLGTLWNYWDELLTTLRRAAPAASR